MGANWLTVGLFLFLGVLSVQATSGTGCSGAGRVLIVAALILLAAALGTITAHMLIYYRHPFTMSVVIGGVAGYTAAGIAAKGLETLIASRKGKRSYRRVMAEREKG